MRKLGWPGNRVYDYCLYKGNEISFPQAVCKQKLGCKFTAQVDNMRGETIANIGQKYAHSNTYKVKVAAGIDPIGILALGIIANQY